RRRDRPGPGRPGPRADRAGRRRAPPGRWLLARHAPAAPAGRGPSRWPPGALTPEEPANGLDPEGVHWLRGLIRGLADEGRTVLVSSHVLAEVAQTVDQVVIIDRGRLVAQSTLAALTAGADRTVRVRTPQA